MKLDLKSSQGCLYVCMVTYANPQLQLEGVLKQEVVPGKVLTSRLMD